MASDTLIVNNDPQPALPDHEIRFADFPAFLSWVRTHWHDQQALQHAQWVVSPYVAQAQRARVDVDSWRTAPWLYPRSESSQANLGTLVPSALRWLDASSARSLVSYQDAESELSLSGLTELDSDTAQQLAAFAGTLDLSGLRRLTPEVATQLAAHAGLIKLDGLRSIGGTLVPLVRRRGARGGVQPGLSLGSLRRISPQDAHLLAHVQGDLHLNGLADLDVQQAKLLAQRQGDHDKKLGTLHLDGWAHPSPDALQALGAYRGPLSLGAWTPPATASAQPIWSALASAPRESLSLGGVSTLKEADAQALAALQLKRLYLPGIHELGAGVIEYLGGMVLQRLALDGVRKASAVQIRRLVQLQHKDTSTSGLSMASLELTPEVRAELMRHKKLLDPLYDRVYADA